MEDLFAHLRETLERVPPKPGVYKMKGESGEILYIGKAKALRSRVRSYFQSSADHSPRISRMVGQVRSIEYIVTASEVEALILEDNLIKEKKPQYNVMLRDDKNYPYLKLTVEEMFPRLFLARKVARDKSMYFGPFVSGKAVRSTLRMINKIFPLRESRDPLDGTKLRRPCLNHQMGRCLAPCAGKVTEAEYREVVEQVILFLKGRSGELLETLRDKMTAASENQWYEAAAKYRDQIAAVQALGEKQSITHTGLLDEDVIASWEEAGRSVIRLFRVRGGKMNEDRSFLFDSVDKADRAEALAAFIRQFYSGDMEIPKAVIVNSQPDSLESLEELLTSKRGAKVSIVVPEKGRRKKLAVMAEKNAMLRLSAVTESGAGRAEALEEIQDRLGLDSVPSVIEACDISNTGGLNSVGSLVVFADGAPAKSEYRKYKIKTVSGPDDYSSLTEIVERRVTRQTEEGAQMAGLLVVDGGKGQVNAVAARLAEIGGGPPVVGIAKGSERENPETDRFFVPSENGAVEVEFPPSSPGRFLLQRARDEAHRFAIGYHKKLRDKSMSRSVLDDIPGVGPKRKKALLKHFGSVKKIREASVEEISAVLKVSEKVAEKISEILVAE